MAYITGTAASVASLLTAIQGACTANGWTLAGSVLSKGTCYQRLTISGTQLQLTAGTGIDVSNNLLGIADELACVLGRTSTLVAYAFPLDYFIHINTAPDEVYVVVRYGGTFYQCLAFGQSAQPGLVGGGNWYSGSQNTVFGANTDAGSLLSSGGDNGSCAVMGLFYGIQYAGNRQNGAVHHALDSATWKVEGAWRDWYSPFILQPNAFNSRSILIPIRVYAPRTGGFISPVLECRHARYVNLANMVPEQVITLGPDRWRVYPWWAKDARLGIVNCGHALRYDGP